MRLFACWRLRPSRCSRSWPRSPSTAARALRRSARCGLRSRRLCSARSLGAPGRHSLRSCCPVRSRLDPLRSRDRALLRLARSDRRLARFAPGVQLSGARRCRCRAARPRTGVEDGGSWRSSSRSPAWYWRSWAGSAARSIRSGSRSRSRLRSSMRRTCSSPTACWGRLSRCVLATMLCAGAATAFALGGAATGSLVVAHAFAHAAPDRGDRDRVDGAPDRRLPGRRAPPRPVPRDDPRHGRAAA